MMNTWEQRVIRNEVKLTKISVSGAARAIRSGATLRARDHPATKVIHFMHISNLTGHIFPVKEICALARKRGILTIVDGAHAYGHFPFKITDFDCDYYGSSLHKWLLAPSERGALRSARSHREDLGPAAARLAGEEHPQVRGNRDHPAANANAIAEALVFHRGIGIERKAARLRFLKERWARRMEETPGAKVLTSFDPAQGCAIGLLSLAGHDPEKLTAHLWAKQRTIVTPIKHAEFQGLRITPNLYTTLSEVDGFVAAIDDVLKNGIS